jgi:hypothetical protein
MASVNSEKISPPQNPSINLSIPEPPFWGRLETLWLLIGPLCTAIYALCQSLAPNDLWYHIRAGEFISRWGTIPTKNLMSYGVSLDTPFYYQSWLAEWLLFKTLQTGGLSGLQMLRAFCLTCAVTLLVIATFRFTLRNQVSNSSAPPNRLGAARSSALATLWGFMMLSNNLDLRPQTFSVLLCGAWIIALLEFNSLATYNQISKKKLWWGGALCLLTLIWANTHGAFILAILSLLAFTTGKAVTRRPETKIYAILLGCCLLAGLFNPRGIELYRYVFLLSNNEIGQKYIQEWGAPDLSEWHNWLFFLSLPICTLLAAIGLRKQREILQTLVPLLIVLAVVFLMGMRDIRSIIWFAFFLTPILTIILNYALNSKSGDNNTHTVPIPPRGAAVMNLVLLIMLVALPIPLIPSIKASLPWPDEFKQRFAPTPKRLFPNDPPLLLDRTTPVEPIEYWENSPPRGRVFTDMVCGSYMTYATHPQILPLCEPRIELFEAEFWEEYVRLSNGEGDVQSAMDKWGCSEALLDLNTQRPLAKKLKDLGWKQISIGGKTLLLRKP